MNKLTIIGNLTRDPELRCTTSGVSVCSFTVAVNRRLTVQQRQNGQQPEADFFNISAWRELGENCSKYLAKGRKVCVVGPVSVRLYNRSDGSAGASLEVTAEDVEFLTPKGEGTGNMDHQGTSAAGTGSQGGNVSGQVPQQEQKVDAQTGFQQVNMEQDEFPF